RRRGRPRGPRTARRPGADRRAKPGRRLCHPGPGSEGGPHMTRFSWQRLFAIGFKEALHIVRDPQTLFFTLFIPVLDLILLGYAIDTNVRYVPTVVVDLAGTQESRALVRRFENSQDFRVVAAAYTEAEANQCLVAGRARVGLVIPADYSQKLEAGETAQVLVLVDGTISSIAAEAVNVGNALALRESLE